MRSTGRSDNASQLVGLFWIDRVGLLADGQVKFEVDPTFNGTLSLTYDAVDTQHHGLPAEFNYHRLTRQWYVRTW